MMITILVLIMNICWNICTLLGSVLHNENVMVRKIDIVFPVKEIKGNKNK